MTTLPYDVLFQKHSKARPIFMWTKGVPVEQEAREQLLRVASLPFIHSHLAVMPDVHFGKGATIGSVIPTTGAIIPAAVGVDIGCGMCAVKTTLKRSDLPSNLRAVRDAIEAAVPHGRTDNGGVNDRGAWGTIPQRVQDVWDEELAEGYSTLLAEHPRIERANSLRHLGTLGTGNHFIEVTIDTDDNVWLMLHSGSRGVGAFLAGWYMKQAKNLMKQFYIDLPDTDLAYLPEDHALCDGYIRAVSWAQHFAKCNRKLMLEASIEALARVTPRFTLAEPIIDCHHNYVARERHDGVDLWVTRKGAVRAGAGDLGIIPGSMGARSHIVRGKGERTSFMSCSHGAGRAMSRSEAKRRFTADDHAFATSGVECRKDTAVIDETPAAYKDIDAVMHAQADLVDLVDIILILDYKTSCLCYGTSSFYRFIPQI